MQLVFSLCSIRNPTIAIIKLKKYCIYVNDLHYNILVSSVFSESCMVGHLMQRSLYCQLLRLTGF